ncbi:uncharacterized protein BXZ73DRAFT_76540 [Epithele typhae]|uniref:uncharacterized protein n=1 Tax=Epithele typhae TaxID=378194 RepID=UPI0020071F0F|nr:uncharacterized protein BXZ73DRAFT_76540 [Epithele typhae]KAH9937921.1 hypothetical protein BXZ73DRAFT_76540 [Epithele typhae]
MAPYPAYAPQSPSSNIPYSNVRQNSLPQTNAYPPPNRYDRSATSLDSEDSADHDKAKWHAPGAMGPRGPAVEVRAVTRTPSPTPSEAKELKKSGIFDWQAMSKLRYWFRKEWAWYYIIFIVCLVGAILFTVYHKTIVNRLRPAADWMHDLPFGWTIPIAVLFVISFPPLFGHEIVAILCGLVWGLGVGFAIVAAGTFLGELGNFYAFKYCCAARGEKLERDKLSYACLARVVREGGFKIALIARLSAIPGHFTTAVFSTCGMGVITFSIAAILSLPKQFITVYLGVALEQSEDGHSSTKDTIIKDSVLGVTALVTIGAMWYIYDQMNKVKVPVIYERRKARQAKLDMAAAPGMPYGNTAMLESTASVAFDPSTSTVDIPLNGYQRPAYNQHPYAAAGRGMHAPQPRRPQQPMSERYPNAALPPGAGYAYPVLPSELPSHRVVPGPGGDPFSDGARVLHQQQQQAGVSYQRQGPARGYGSPPPDTFPSAGGQRRGPRHPGLQEPSPRPQQEYAQQPQPTRSPPPVAHSPTNPYEQSAYAAHSYASPASPPPLPSMAATQNPFSDPRVMPNPYEQRSVAASAPPASHGQEMPNPYERHAAQPTDATFYTAHSRSATEEPLYPPEKEEPPSYMSHEHR